MNPNEAHDKDSEFNIALKNLLHFQELRTEALMCIRQKNFENAAEVCWEMHLEISGYLKDSSKKSDEVLLKEISIHKDNFLSVKGKSFSNRNAYIDNLVRQWLELLIAYGYKIGWLAKKIDRDRLALMG